MSKLPIKGREQLTDAMQVVVNNALSNLHTMTIAKVTKVGQTTISVMPVINRVVDGKEIQLPEFIEVPPIFMQGGNSYTTYPLSVGDYCLLMFTERCFDRWYSGEDFVAPAEYRMHDYSDGFALIGVNPMTSSLTIPQKITQVGDTIQQGDYEHTGKMHRIGDSHFEGGLWVEGDLYCSGTIFCNNVQPYSPPGGPISGGRVSIDGVKVKEHYHTQEPDSRGDTQENTSGPVNP